MIQSLIELEQIYRVFDSAEETLTKQIGVPICIPNCGKCCEVAVPIVYRIEAAFIISTALGDGNYNSLVSFSEGWLLEHHKIAPTYEGIHLGAIPDKLREEFYNLGKSLCPFLIQAGKFCLTHRGRPMACRAYGVTHMPGMTPDYCPRQLGINETRERRAYVDIPGIKELVLNFVQRMSNQDMRVCGLLPTAIFKLAKPDKYRDYIEDNKIASAKLIGLPYQYLGLITQEQMEKEYTY